MPPQKPKAKPERKTCLWDSEPVYCRGLCSACYQALHSQAGGDDAKWKKFEDAGDCLRKRTKAKSGIRKRLAERESQTKKV